MRHPSCPLHSLLTTTRYSMQPSRRCRPLPVAVSRSYSESGLPIGLPKFAFSFLSRFNHHNVISNPPSRYKFPRKHATNREDARKFVCVLDVRVCHHLHLARLLSTEASHFEPVDAHFP
ncbi:hypothetical protein BJV74DRAFT_453546 [Russula compacta]|nr:hypothetical protein BJV74DRAFT_453546 [Russula compacta]